LLARRSSPIELTAAHKKIALRVGANVLTLLIDEFAVADGTVVPPIFLRLRLNVFRQVIQFLLASNGQVVIEKFHSDKFFCEPARCEAGGAPNNFCLIAKIHSL
jgi:hypothetical protein